MKKTVELNKNKENPRVHFLNLGKYKMEKIFKVEIAKQDLNIATKKTNWIADSELISPTAPIENGSNKKKNLRSLEFLNFTNTSTKTIIANTTIEK
jgi:hypothetical protein